MNIQRRGRLDAWTTQLARQRPAAALIVVDPPTGSGRSIPVDVDGLAIGRAGSSGLVLTDPAASRKHAVVHARGGEYVVEDRHSLNGTFVNGERITAPRELRDGDRLRFGRLVAEFRLVNSVVYRPNDGRGPGPDWNPSMPTRPIEPSSPTLRDGLREAPGFSFGALALAVLGSVVGTILIAAIQADGPNQSANWRLFGAALGPIISTTFTTRQSGEKGRVRAASIALLSSAALVVTATGFNVGEVVKGSSLLPGVAQGSTLPVPGLSTVIIPRLRPELVDRSTATPTPTPDPGGPALQVPDAQDCGSVVLGEASLCGPVIVASTGGERLEILGVEVQGTHRADFIVDPTCASARLEPDEVCEIVLAFRPTDEGQREAILVVGHNGLDGETEVRLTGVGEAGPAPDPATGQDS